MKSKVNMATTFVGETRIAGKDPKVQSPLTVTPSAISFEGIQPGVLYVMTFAVRNNTLQSNRIRITVPKTKYFALNYVPCGSVAPGLDLRAEIECQLPETFLLDQYNFNDIITVSMGPYTYDIPLYASRPGANIVFNPLLNFGYVADSVLNRKAVTFKNVGVIPGTVTLRQVADDSKLRIDEKTFRVLPDEEKTVEFVLDTVDMGPYRELIQVDFTDSTVKNAVLDVMAEVTEQKLVLLTSDNNGILDKVDFGSIYYGQVTTISAFIVNTGPKPLSYSISYLDEDMGAAPQTDGKEPDIASMQIEKFMQILPSDGVVQPFAHLPVLIRFTPELPVITKGFAKQHTEDTTALKIAVRKAFIESVEIGQKFGVTLEGSVSSPHITMSPSILKFGSCAINDRRDIAVVITNHSNVSSSFECKKIAHYKITPSSGELQPHQSRTLVASFLPSQFGKFKSMIHVSIAGGVSLCELKLVGEAYETRGKKVLLGGVDKSPADFETKYNFVDPAKVREELMQKTLEASKKEEGRLKKTTSVMQESMIDYEVASGGSRERDAVYGFGSVASSQKTLTSNHPLEIRRANDQYYNEFLQTSQLARLEHKRTLAKNRLLARGANDRSDPSAVDMGMDRGLDEPCLKAPLAGEPLWLANRPGGAGGGRSRMPTDENRLIQKKFSDTPSTQAEMRDCEAELDIDHLKSVAASHKLLDFGKASATAVLCKNFTVTNELEHSVLVRIGDLEPEVRQSKPAAQVIPAGATAGFDIYFTSKTLGIYRKSFSWTINGKHMFKVSVAADVVPIELVLNKTNLMMEFPDDSVEPSLIQDVILTNPGNSVAEFLWGSSGAFVCQPEKGNINPGQAAMVSIIWTPVVGKRNDEELGLHVSGGVDQTLSVIGKIQEAKCAFEDKICALGTIAMGTEKVVECTLKNSGTCSAVFFVDGFEEKFGISINPMRGVIPAGESITLECQFIPREALSYENLKLTAVIRGGKTAALKLSGESIIPAIDVANESYAFGTVTVGSQHTLPLTLVNKSAIAATLILDLSSYPDFFPRVRMCNNDPTEVVSRFQEDNAGNKMEVAVETDGGDSSDQRSKKSKGGVKWKVVLQPGAVMNGSIAFTPKLAKSYAFKLPLNLLGISDRSFGKEVSGESTKPRLQLGSPSVDFGDCVVSRDADGRTTYFMEVVMTNIDKRGFAYELREELPDPVTAEIERKRAAEGSLVPPLFFVAQTKGTLGVGMSASVRVSFSPQMAGDFQRRIDVYLTDQVDEGRPYMILILRGSGVYPKITFDCQSLALPTVPLGISSKGMFTIFNNGYSNVDLKYRLSPTITIPLELTFPDGQTLDIQKHSIRVIVAAKSDVACSWVGKVEFSGTDGEKFYVSLSGCSDGCLLTTYNFVRTYSEQYGFMGLEGQPVQFLSRAEIGHFMAEEARKKEQARKQRSLELQKKAAGGAPDKEAKGKGAGNDKASIEEKESMPSLSLDIVDGIDLDNPELNAKLNAFDETEAIFVLKWLNRFVCRKPFDAERFPDCIVDTHGDLVIDCVEQMSGAKVSGVKEDPPSTGAHRGGEKQRGNQREAKLVAARRLVQKYKALLSFLTRYGALVNHLDPISLLGLDDYLHVQESDLRMQEGARLTQAMLQEWRANWMDSWHNCCSRAWLDILMQVLKVFSFSRVNFKTLSSTPGVSIDAPAAAPKDKGGKKGQSARAHYPLEFAPSNVFTHAESCLLEWASQHMSRACKLPDEGAGKDAAVVFPRRLVDLDHQLADLYPLCQLLHSHLPDATREGGALKGYSLGDRTKRDANFNRLNSLLVQYRLDFGVNELDITASGRTLLLTLLHLFLNLPCLIPKTKIEFRGYLGLPMMKSIELKNPSRKKICYAVTLAGSRDFSITSHELVIPPNGSVDFPVTVTARFAESAAGVITFTGVREAGVAGATMVFGLESFIIGRKPVSVTKKTCSVFELESFVIDVKNPFDRDMNFALKIMSSHSGMKIADAVAGKPMPAATRPRLHAPAVEPAAEEPVSPSKRGGKAADKDDDRELEEMHKNAFWCKEELLQIPARGTRPLTVNFLPFTLGTHCCQVVLIDKNAGEFCYEIEAETGLPVASDVCTFSVEIGRGPDNSRKALRVSSRNGGFERALQAAMDTRLTNPGKKQRLRALLQNLVAAPITDEETGVSNFVVEIQSPYFNCLKALPFVSEYAPSPVGAAGRAQSAPAKYKKCARTLIDEVAPAEANSSSAPNSTFFNFMPERPGLYKARAVIYSKDNAFDVRVIDICGTVTLAALNQVLEFRGPARRTLSQDIPIRNDGPSDWSLQAHVAGRGFSGPKALAVPRGATATYTISFTGPFVGSFDGVLQLKSGEGDCFEYKLQAAAEEPLSEGSLHFKCNARAKKAFSIPLKQVPRGPAPLDAAPEDGRKAAVPGSQLFTVQTDIPYLLGAAEVEVAPGGSAYDFSILAPVGGLLAGSVTFTEKETGAVAWFAVEVDVTGPQAESVIAVESVVRRAVAVEISLVNPTKGALQFSVALEGEGVIGDPTYTLPADAAAAPYELIYSPLVDGPSQGRISFINDSVGEFWYRLDLNAVPAEPTAVDTVEAMVGSSTTVQVPLDNPLPAAVTLAVAVSNPDHFSVDSETITLEGYAQSFFNLTFTPSAIGELAVGDVVFSHRNFGNMHYKVSGVGQLPGNMPAVHMAAPLGEMSSHAIFFRNPFAFSLPVDIVLSCSEGADARVFTLLLRKATDIVIPPKTPSQISLGFKPSRLGVYSATVQVRSSVGGRSLLWCFPLSGVAEAASLQVLEGLSTPCKTSLIREVSVPLEGLLRRNLAPGELVSLAEMSQELVLEDKVAHLINRSFRAQFVEIVQLSDEEAAGVNSSYVLKMRLLFEPLKEFMSFVEMVVELKNKGRWRVRVQLHGTEPEPDDTIRLTAAVGGIDKVAFRLSNRFLGPSSYQAYFTAKSSLHFSISPSSGVLQPYGSEGSPFVVTFAPLEYGGRDQAQLVVVTDDAQWNFDCVGLYPDVSVNNLEIRSKIDSGIVFR